jgi:nitrogen regulatory protein PII
MNYKIITAIITENKVTPIVQALADKGIVTANKSKGRGSSMNNLNGIEIDIISVLVEESQADEVFSFIYKEANIAEPHNGMIYQQAVPKASNYKLQ